MTNTSRALAVLVLAVAGCGASDAAFSSPPRRPAISGGQQESGYPAVGLLRSGGFLCGATLFDGGLFTPDDYRSRLFVITAAHCLFGTEQDAPPLHLLDDIAFYPNVDAYDPQDPQTGAEAVTSAAIHPEFQGDPPHYWVSVPTTDVAVLRLQSAYWSVSPAALSQQEPAAGDAVALVGIGRTASDSEDQGVKRSAAAAIEKVEPMFLHYGSGGGNICQGDSGGATFRQGDPNQIVGVHVRGNCGSKGRDLRVDPLADEGRIAAWIRDQASPGGAWSVHVGVDERVVRGHVRAPDGSPLSGVEVTAWGHDDGLLRQSTTRADGYFAIRWLPDVDQLYNVVVNAIWSETDRAFHTRRADLGYLVDNNVGPSADYHRYVL